jgi:hypothetical protein
VWIYVGYDLHVPDMLHIPRYQPRRTMGAEGQPDCCKIFFADITLCGASGPLGRDMSCLVIAK